MKSLRIRLSSLERKRVDDFDAYLNRLTENKVLDMLATVEAQIAAEQSEVEV